MGRVLTVRAAKGSRVTIRVKGRKLIRRMRSTRLRIHVGRLRPSTVVGILVTRPGYQDRHIRIRA